MTRHGYRRVKKKTKKKTGQPGGSALMSRAIHHIETKKGRGEIFKKKKNESLQMRGNASLSSTPARVFWLVYKCGSEVALNVDNRFPKSRRLSLLISLVRQFMVIVFMGSKVRKLRGQRKSNHSVLRCWMRSLSETWVVTEFFHHQLCWLPLKKSTDTNTKQQRETFFFFFWGCVHHPVPKGMERK